MFHARHVVFGYRIKHIADEQIILLMPNRIVVDFTASLRKCRSARLHTLR